MLPAKCIYGHGEVGCEEGDDENHHDSPEECLRQFHQRYARAFFLQNFGTKNYKAEM